MADPPFSTCVLVSSSLRKEEPGSPALQHHASQERASSFHGEGGLWSVCIQKFVRKRFGVNSLLKETALWLVPGEKSQEAETAQTGSPQPEHCSWGGLTPRLQ